MAASAMDSIEVLHVDDEPDFCNLAADFVERSDEQINVETASSVSEGLDRLSQGEFDCVVSDLEMPEQDGIEFLEAVRKEFPDFPFILFTGKGSEDVASEAISAGVTDYLQKESGTDQYAVLANRIRNCVEGWRAKNERQYMRQRMQLALEYSDSVIFEFDLQTGAVSRIGEFEQFFDREPDEVPSYEDYTENVVHPDHRGDFRRFYQELIDGTRESGTIEYRTSSDAGNSRWIRDKVYVQDDNPNKAIGLAQDITDQKENEQRLERVVSRVTDAIVSVNHNWQFTFVNEQAEELYAMTEDELLGKNFWDIFSAALDTRFEEEYRRVMETRVPTSLAEHFPQLDRWFDVKVYPRDEGGLTFYFVDVTEQKEREQRYNAIFNQTYQFTGLLEPDGTLIEANETALEFGGLDRDEVIGKQMWDAYWFQHSEETRERAEEAVQRAADGEFVRHELPVQGADGDVIIDFSVRPITNEQGEVTLLVPEGRDITELKEREEELQKRTKQLQNIIDTVQGAMWIRNKEGEYEFMNHYHRDQFDIGDDVEVAGKQFSDLLPAEVAEQFQQNDQRVYETEEPVEIEETVETQDGPRNFLTRIAPLFEDGSVYATCGIATDITERVEREQALKESEERYRKLLATAPTPILIYNKSEEVIYANHEAVELFGADDEEEILGLTPQDFIHPDSRDELDARRHRLIEGKEAVPPNKLTLLDRHGREKTVLVASSPITYDGEPAIQTVATDITELKERERQLERYETLVEVSGDPMYMMDTEGHLEYVNEAFVQRVAYGEDELLGEHVSKVMVDHHVERGEELIHSLLTSGDRRGTFEMEALTKAGDRIPAEVHVSLLYHDGEFSGTVGVLRDITERLERERRLQRERDRLDEFSSVVSHDLRNPLRVAEGNLELAIEDGELEALDGVADALDRMDTLIEDMLSLASAGETVGETEGVELATLADACWNNVETASAAFDNQAEGTIQADKTRLQQLLENLLRNAIEHGGEEVTVSIGDKPDGFYVEDNGPGIPPEERDNILEPGYSTREDGTGFGLNIVRDIAEAHGWNISVTEGSDGGARFEFTGVKTE